MNKQAGTKRLFLAFPLTGDQYPVIAGLKERHYPAAKHRWIPDENLHLTLLFLGDIPLQQIPEISRRTEEACTGFGSFSLNSEAIETYRKRNRGLIWIKMEKKRQLDEIYSAVTDGLSGVNGAVYPESIRPHITLARFKPGKTFLPQISISTREVFLEIKKLLLLESVLSTNGARYFILREFHL